MTIDAERAKLLAESFVGADSDRFKFQHLATRASDGDFAVVFAVFDLDGNEIDGPYIVLVDKMTGEARPSYPNG